MRTPADDKEARASETEGPERRESTPRASSASARSSQLEPCPIVAVGASAADLQALVALLGHIPRDTGMAFALVVRPEAGQASEVVAAVARSTRLPVEVLRHDGRVEPDRVYVIPPGLGVGITDGTWTLSSRPDRRALRLPVDRFFEALASAHSNQAIGVVLSGAGADGTAGLGAIRAGDGVTFAQEPTTARLDAMPIAAIEAGVVDRVLPIPALAMELLRLGAHTFVRHGRAELSPPGPEAAELASVLARLRALTGVDFREYDRKGVGRRLARRMALLRLASLSEYERLLRDDPLEVKALWGDLLLHAPSCFADRETPDELQRRVFPELLKKKSDGGPIRVWSAGCGGGEEPYSIVIALLAFLDREGASDVPVQLFGSDVSERAIARARAGSYPAEALRSVGEERLSRYFTPVDGGSFRIGAAVRQRCTFVRHELARDPPFSKLDLVSCRNVLVYFGASLRWRALTNFHFALDDHGSLVVARGESLADGSALFVSGSDAPADHGDWIAKRRAATASFLLAPVRDATPPPLPLAGDDAARVVELSRELLATKDQLRSVRWEHQRAHEGLQALNQELLSRNEELLAVNHELELAKDAQAAANEELRALAGELRARNEVVEDLNRRKDLFLATLSHELRTPLTSLLLQTQMLRRGRLDADRVRRAADGIERAAHAQARLIDDLLDVSRIVTGKLRLEMQMLGFASIVQSAIETLEPTAEKRRVTLDRQIDETLPPVAGDPARLLQVVLNLLTNAIKFTPEGGRVLVQLDAWQSQGRLRVIDTGIGIAPDFLPDIFERFSQEDRGVTRAHGGLGLGLAIVHYLVEAHGGEIVAESAGVGAGSTFTVRLPLLARASEVVPTAGASPPHAVSGNGLQHLRVLVVEDDPGTRDALSDMLGQWGAEVRSVDSAAHAMSAFEELEPDVLVSDVAMPNEDGYHLLARIRARGAQHGGDVPALALTGLASQDDSRRALAAGFQLHLVKPIDTDRLLAALSELVKRRASSPDGGEWLPTRRAR